MEKSKWLLNILSAVKELSDRTYQKRVWLMGEGLEISSFDEAICRLFDDYEFDKFIEEINLIPSLSKELVLLKKYHKELTKYLSTLESKIQIEKLLGDKRWQEICILGEQVYRELKNCHI